MAGHEAYLRSALSKYQHKDVAKRDIMNAIQLYADLRPKLDTFVFNDGSRKELLCLDGTIPVTYKGNRYNIPVCMWLMDTHPYNPPMVFVMPTSTMQIKQGRHVDANGRVYLPYLHEWKHPQSDLLGLAQILVIVFGEEPPVFARPATSVAPRPQYQGSNHPANPPYPPAGSAMPVPGYPAAGAATGYPPQGGYPPPPTTGAYTPYPGYPPSQPAASQPSFAPSSAGYNAYAQPSYNQTATSTAANSLSEAQIKASLRSAVEDKMKRRLKEIFAQAQAEMDSLKKTQDDLQTGKQTLDDMLQKLEREQNDVERNITLLQEKDGEMRAILSRLENQEELDIDEAVSPTAPLYRQLMNVFAEEQATEDAIYYLGEALRKDVIDMDVFLKQVRELSRKQFMLKALITMCREKAGLPELVQ